MLLKIFFLLLVLVLFFFLGLAIFKRKIKPYHPLTWGLIEAFWYCVSFAALCVGLVELERIEKLNNYKELEKALTEDYHNKKSLLYAQTWLLKMDDNTDKQQRDGMLWFHKMRSYFDEGINSSRWEGFLNFSRNYVVLKKVSNFNSHSLEYGWPLEHKIKNDLYLKDEITRMIDSLQHFSSRKQVLQKLKPEENTNYQVRYILIFFFMAALALKFLKIYADYRRNTEQN